MRVLIDTSALLRGAGGTAVYVRRLTQALADAGVEVIEAADTTRAAPGGGGAASARNALHDLAWRARLGARARAVAADVVHHPLPAWAWSAGCPQVVTVHDLAFLQAPELFAPAYRRWAAVAHRRAVTRAGAVVCVSSATREELLRRWAVPSQRAVVAHHGPGQWFGQPDPPARGVPRHFLYVGDAEPRKRLPLLLAGYRRYRATAGEDALALVLAGTGLEAAASGAGPGVTVVPRPSADRLRELHAGAAALVHTAVLEGFGLTPLEAMHLGTPVLAAPSAAVVEVCGDAARYLPADQAERAGAAADAGGGGSPDALATELTRLAGDARLRDELTRAGLRRSESFSWEASARAHIQAYTLALSVSLQTGPSACP